MRATRAAWLGGRGRRSGSDGVGLVAATPLRLLGLLGLHLRLWALGGTRAGGT